MADLLTINDVATRLNVTDGDGLAVINDLINTAQKTIENITYRSLSVATTRTEYYDAGKGFIHVEHPPIVSVVSLEDQAWAKGSNAARAISSDDWISSSDDQGKRYNVGKVELCNTESVFGGATLDVRICYNGGWTTSTLPADLREAWIQLVMVWFDFQGRNSGESANASLTTPDAVPKALLQVFNRYSLRGVRPR